MTTTVKTKSKSKQNNKHRAEHITAQKLRKVSSQRRKELLERQFAKGAVVYAQDPESILPDVDEPV